MELIVNSHLEKTISGGYTRVEVDGELHILAASLQTKSFELEVLVEGAPLHTGHAKGGGELIRLDQKGLYHVKESILLLGDYCSIGKSQGKDHAQSCFQGHFQPL